MLQHLQFGSGVLAVEYKIKSDQTRHFVIYRTQRMNACVLFFQHEVINMNFYEVEAKAAKSVLNNDSDKKKCFAEKIQNSLDYYNGKLSGKRRIYVCSVHKKEITLISCFEINDMGVVAQAIVSYLSEIDLKIVDISAKEITFSRFAELLESASKNDFIDDDDEELKRLEIEDIRRFGGTDRISEIICDAVSDEKTALEKAKEIFCFPDLKDEITRIVSSKNPLGLKRHPVHYVLMSDNIEQMERARNLIVGSLNLSQRLSSLRVCLVRQNLLDAFGRVDSSERLINSVFKSQEGATMILQPKAKSLPSGVLDSSHQQLHTLLSGMGQNCRDTLCIVEIGSNDDMILEQIRQKIPNLRLVVLREKAMTIGDAKKYLTDIALKDGIESVSTLLSEIDSQDSKFFPAELNTIYERWLDRYMCEDLFPQYKDIELNENHVEQKVEGTAYSKLMDMVGLSEAKRILQSAIDFHKGFKRYSDFGVKVKPGSMHMVFTGNPGSAKTTVARLFAQILKENDILKSGRFVEAGRYNIVDMYLGGTAPRVSMLFEQACGGVLFIDEAYSLVDGQRGLYGDEAINTIVQEMENHRQDVIVIFAGYPERMKAFLDSNPGLRSRIAFNVHFEDYSTDELFKILQSFAKNQNMILGSDVESKVKGIFEQVKTHSDFGNGRFVRNLFEQAQMLQSTRIASMKTRNLTRKTISTLIADDFAFSTESTNNEHRPMGFHL